MDHELTFWSSLLNANNAEQRKFWYSQIPLQVFRLHPTEAHWVYSYRDKHGKYPSAKLFEHRHSVELEVSEDPPLAALEPLMEKWMFAQVENIIEKSARMVTAKKSMSEVIEYFRKSSNELQTTTHEHVDLKLKDHTLAFRSYADKVRNRKKGGMELTSPWPTMNRIVKFFRPGELVTFAGRPAMGKTYVILWLAYHLAVKGARVLIISKEMPADQVLDRLTAIQFELPWSEFRGLDMSPEQVGIWKAKRLKSKAKLEITVTGEESYEGVGLEYVIAKVKQEKPDVVILDGAYLVTPSGVRKEASDSERFSALSRANKRIAKTSKTLFIQTVQMNRSADKGNGVAKGGMSTVFGSDSWAQDTDYLFEVAGDPAARERVIATHKAREAAIGDFFVNFNFAPKIDIREKPALSGDLGPKIKFRIVG